MLTGEDFKCVRLEVRKEGIKVWDKDGSTHVADKLQDALYK
jgi:hypothetical protein